MVRIATSGMYYPGTMERAVLVAGETEGVKVRGQHDSGRRHGIFGRGGGEEFPYTQGRDALG